ncbi:MAG: hypothetical protein Q8R83_01535 [Legionellaceae bacterium]|nr:hypothetical protein [Legionellaceae bacterium]
MVDLPEAFDPKKPTNVGKRMVSSERGDLKHARSGALRGTSKTSSWQSAFV